jgi:hypothetical protein
MKGAGDGLGDVVLDRKDVRQLSFVALRPQMAAVGPCDELRRDTNATARPADAAVRAITFSSGIRATRC